MPSEPQRKSKHKHCLQFAPGAWTEWQARDGFVKETLRTLLKKHLDDPHEPGAQLHGTLTGYYKIKLRKQGYRLVYGVRGDVLSDVLILMVVAVDLRVDKGVYQSAMVRVAELAKVGPRRR